jgi:hypothetical protein
MAVPFAASFVADVPFVYYNGYSICCIIMVLPFIQCNGCSFCYLIAGRCSICIYNGCSILLPYFLPMLYLFMKMAVPFATSSLAAVPFVLIIAVPFDN